MWSWFASCIFALHTVVFSDLCKLSLEWCDVSYMYVADGWGYENVVGVSYCNHICIADWVSRDNPYVSAFSCVSLKGQILAVELDIRLGL